MEPLPPELPDVLLVRPQEEGNIGAAARAMANMGLRQLVLVEPAPALGGIARGFGVGGWHLLDGCHRAPTFEEAIAPYRRLIGTTSARGRPVRHAPVIPARDLVHTLTLDPPGTPTALVFGSEASGLTRAELEHCDPVVTIPCDAEHPTLNLAQSVLLLAYELRRHEDPLTVTPEAEPPALSGEIETLLARTGDLLFEVGFDQPNRRATYLRELRRLLRRSRVESRDVRLLLRLVNRLRSTRGGE